MKKILIVLPICLLAILFCGSARGLTMVDSAGSQAEYGRRVAALTAQSDTRKRGTAQTLVLLKTDGTRTDFSGTGAESCISGPGNRFTLVFSDPETAKKAVSLLQENEHILYAEEEREITACDTATEEEIAFESYGAEKMKFQPLLSWARKEGKSSSVAVIDSGIGTHPALNSRTVKGWDYIDNDDDPTNDEYGHGTHVAGILADCTKGLDVDLYAIRILDANGRGKTPNAVNAILEAAEAGTPIINLSFAAPGDSEAMDDAVSSAVSAGCTVVAAAGNYGQDASKYCPAHLTIPGVIVVGSVGENGEKASYSNYGASVDCYAYGSGIRSCSPGGGYNTRSGTSQAAPHIAAACAMLKMLYGGGPASIENGIKALMDTGTGTAIPRLDAKVPRRISCHLTHLTMGLGEALALPTAAEPAAANQAVLWTSTDETVLRADESGTVTAVGTGQAELIRTCSNFEEAHITVTVTEGASGRLVLPESLTTLEAEALQGTGGDYILLGERINEIGENAPDSGAVILCTAGSPAAEIAEERGWPYIAQ